MCYIKQLFRNTSINLKSEFLMYFHLCSEYKAMFAAFDTNNDKKISSTELEVLIRALGYDPDVTVLAEVMKEADTNSRCLKRGLLSCVCVCLSVMLTNQ